MKEAEAEVELVEEVEAESWTQCYKTFDGCNL